MSRPPIVRATIVCCAIASLVQLCRATADLERLELVCKSKLDIKTIGDFRQFVGDLRSAPPGDQLDKKRHANLIKCLDELEAIEALAQLVDGYDRVRPCKMAEVNKLDQFARDHLLRHKKSLAFKFFRLFGVQVGLSCKLNLMAHVKQADLEAEQLDFIYAMAAPTGWNVLINEYTKKSMKFGTSTHAESHVINKVARLVSGLSRIDNLDYLEFDHVMNEIKVDNWNGIERGQHEVKNVAIKSELTKSIERIISSCTALDAFYVNSLLAMAKLVELGLMVDFLNDLHERSVLLHKWLAAASFCQLMARVKLTTSSANNSLEFEIIHDDKLLINRRKLYSYVAKMDEITEQARESVWLASVNEGAWRQKSEAMWLPGNDGTSVAMRQLKQFIKGVEQDFQELEDERA